MVTCGGLSSAARGPGRGSAPGADWQPAWVVSESSGERGRVVGGGAAAAAAGRERRSMKGACATAAAAAPSRSAAAAKSAAAAPAAARASASTADAAGVAGAAAGAGAGLRDPRDVATSTCVAGYQQETPMSEPKPGSDRARTGESEPGPQSIRVADPLPATPPLSAIQDHSGLSAGRFVPAFELVRLVSAFPPAAVPRGRLPDPTPAGRRSAVRGAVPQCASDALQARGRKSRPEGRPASRGRSSHAAPPSRPSRAQTNKQPRFTHSKDRLFKQ